MQDLANFTRGTAEGAAEAALKQRLRRLDRRNRLSRAGRAYARGIFFRFEARSRKYYFFNVRKTRQTRKL